MHYRNRHNYQNNPQPNNFWQVNILKNLFLLKKTQ